MTKQDIFNLVEEEDVRFVRLQFTDILGTMRNMAITTSKLKDALDNNCMFDGSSIKGFVSIEESDLYLHPDLDTFTIFPWRPHQGKVARLICDVYKPDGTRLESDPRRILQNAARIAFKTRTVRLIYVAYKSCNLTLMRTPRENSERVKVGMKV